MTPRWRWGLLALPFLLVGVGANPGALNMDEELRRFDWKVQAGAEYVVTQPVFDLDLLEQFLRRTESYRIPIIAGIWPLTSYRNAEVMVNELRVPVRVARRGPHPEAAPAALAVRTPPAAESPLADQMQTPDALQPAAHAIITTLHQTNAAVLLGLATLLAVWCWRLKGA